MPVYGYRCSRGHHFEVQQRITEAPLSQCPECAAAVTRVFYPVGIIFKGGGFYKTDSRGASSDGAKPADTAKPDAKTETKTETKSDTKAPAKTDQTATTKEGAA
ncbi:MAG: FmdB family transcriptional regulator [Chloroflexi bacterium]|nr:MAG: FmdB family transcriptional regulator [Chloroflexota bacterium]